VPAGPQRPRRGNGARVPGWLPRVHPSAAIQANAVAIGALIDVPMLLRYGADGGLDPFLTGKAVIDALSTHSQNASGRCPSPPQWQPIGSSTRTSGQPGCVPLHAISARLQVCRNSGRQLEVSRHIVSPVRKSPVRVAGSGGRSVERFSPWGAYRSSMSRIGSTDCERPALIAVITSVGSRPAWARRENLRAMVYQDGHRIGECRPAAR
jgi:hypothetical protein